MCKVDLATVEEIIADPDTFIRFATALKEERAATEQLRNKNAALQIALQEIRECFAAYEDEGLLDIEIC